MAELTQSPYEPELRLVTPTMRFTAVSERVYQNFFGGQRVDLKLSFNNMSRGDFGRFVSETSLLVQPPPSGDVYDPANRSAFLAGGYYIWIPFAKLGFPLHVATNAVVTNITGRRLVFNVNIPSTVSTGDWIGINGFPLLVQQVVSRRTMLVSPVPRHVSIGDTAFRQEDGGWFTLDGDLPAWKYKPAREQYGAPYVLMLNGVV